jgi:transposase
MLNVETIRKIRIARHRDHKPIRQIARELNISRNSVKAALRSDATEYRYERERQPRPKMGPFIETLERWLAEDQKKPVKERRSHVLLFEALQRQGYEGGYDSVRRYARMWHELERGKGAKAFVPLSFDPGEAFQFDWSHEKVEIAGMPAMVKIAHFRLCHSRLFFCVAYPRETLEMVLDAHERAFEFFGGCTRRGIYDNLKTVVTKVLMGKHRVFNRRFQQLASHYLFEPVACTPAAGWEKGQVENQVGVVRRRFFVPKLSFDSIEELNRHLRSRCLAWATTQKHPEFGDRKVWEVFEEERSRLASVAGSFDGYQETPARVSSTSLVSFDRNRYSVACSEVGKTVSVRAYADRIVIVSEGRPVGEHPRQFGRDRTVYDAWHYVPVLEMKPGALRNGAPFKNWSLPQPLEQMREALSRHDDGDRQFVGILSAVKLYGLEATSTACEAALAAKSPSRDVVLNVLGRATEETTAAASLPCVPQLLVEPVADCTRYDSLLGGRNAA